ncbi:MAG: hypothetical protein GX410_02870, partial [Elusimicrobia bacterium]|nr:hypothetical protein [Elusimicrobiota bacterium]
VLAAARFFSSQLCRAANAGRLPRFVCFAIALSPLVTDGIGNWLLSEGVSYALLLASAGLMLRMQESLRMQDLLALVTAMTLNMLNRPQMLFIYPVYAAAVILILRGHYAASGRKFRPAKALLWAILPFAAAGLLGRSWNLARYGSFTASDFPGRVQLASSLLYVSDTPDLALFRDKPYYPAMERIYQQKDELKLSAKYRHDVDMNYAAYLDGAIKPRGIYSNFSSRSDVLYFHVLTRELYCFASGQNISREEWKESGKIDYSDTAAWLAARSMADDISRTLAPACWTEYLKLLGSRIKKSVSFGRVLLFVMFAALPLAWPGRAQNFISASAFAALFNLLLTASCTSVLRRFTFYTDTMLLISALLLLWLLYRTRSAPTDFRSFPDI